MRLRFCSGSVTPARSARKSSAAFDRDQTHSHVALERLDNLLGFALAQQAVVDEHARELIADGPVDQRRSHSRVDPAAQAANHLTVAHLLADRLSASTIRFAAVQSGRQPQMSSTKLCSIALPWGVCCTSGWNCTP